MSRLQLRLQTLGGFGSEPFEVEAGRSDRNGFRMATYVLAVIVLASALVLFRFSLTAALLLASLLLGWSELNGRCGTSHVSTLTPLRSMQPRNLWLRAVSTYTVSGALSSSGVGAIAGLLGEFVVPMRPALLVGIVIGGVVLAGGELHLWQVRIPQVRRQTNKMWAFEFGVLPAATMWGIHIGLGFATVIRHGGFIVLAPFAMAEGTLGGATILCSYWIGRTLPLWVAPYIVPRNVDGVPLVEMIQRPERAYAWSATIGIVMAVCVAIAELLEVLEVSSL